MHELYPGRTTIKTPQSRAQGEVTAVVTYGLKTGEIQVEER